MHDELKDIVAGLKSYIDLEKAFGFDECVFSVQGHRSSSGTIGSALEQLKAEVSICKACDLHKTRKSVVFGSGSARAELMFVGEAPGEDEDIQGLPFVGRAGQLLTRIIEAMGLKREDVYIANILKCRPPNNRAPLPTEIEACQENIAKQVEFINPKAIVTLGKFASQTLLKTETPISALRGKFHEYNGIKVMPTFHPAYLLRNPDEKKTVWGDMKQVMRKLQS
jgi:uracil-DNA glycosylase family 4